jgi:hypothetical protein
MLQKYGLNWPNSLPPTNQAFNLDLRGCFYASRELRGKIPISDTMKLSLELLLNLK